MIREWTRGQWALRAVVALGPVLALLAAAPAGPAPGASLVALVAVLSTCHARWPESSVGIAAPVVVVLWWGVGLGDGLSAWALPAAAALLAAHVAALLAGYGPDALGVDVPTVRLWVGRAGAAFLLAPVVLLVATALRGRPEAPGAWVAGLVVALAAALVATSALASGGRQ
jgi:hypothetical protein